MPTGKTMIDTQVQAMLPTLLYARTLLHQTKDEKNQELSDYWTIVSYYNSLKQVGKIYNKIGDEVKAELTRLHKRFLPNHLEFNYKGMVGRTTELTSRVESAKIKNVLKDLEKEWQLDDEKKYVKDTIDLVLASNMFSVGIDIGRLNVMLMNGQPKNIAEYIQASSRVARSREGLVINLLDANLAREKSYFENYLSFHQAYYKFVEPLTVTPFTETTFYKVLNGILVGYVRHIKGLNKSKDAQNFKGDVDEVVEMIEKRIPKGEEKMKEMGIKILKELAEDWHQKVKDKAEVNQQLLYKDLIQDVSVEDQWSLMKSMREVDTNSVIKISANVKTEQQENGEEEQ
jgi:Lhr-like helicase